MMSRCFDDLANLGVCELIPYTPGKPIKELERELGIENSIKLASNENPLGASPLAISAIKEEIDSLHLYPDANGYYLKKALSEKHGIPMECITLGNGSNDLLVLLGQVFLNPAVAALYSQYAFAVYPIVTQLMGAKHCEVPALPEDHPMGLGHDLRAMYEAVTPETRVLFIANPNNPTGTWISGDRLQDFIGSLPAHVICVVDEAYTDYAQGDLMGDASQWIEAYPNLVVTRTFSKAYGLAALRVGYALSHPRLADLLNRARQPFNVGSLGLVAAEAALADVAFLAKSRQVNLEGLTQITQGLAQLGLRVTPSKANFVLAHFGFEVGPINQRLLASGVIVRPVGNYGLPNSLRISVGTATQNQRFLDALSQAISSQTS